MSHFSRPGEGWRGSALIHYSKAGLIGRDIIFSECGDSARDGV